MPEIIGRSDREEERLVNFVKKTSDYMESEVHRLEARIDSQGPKFASERSGSVDLDRVGVLEAELKAQITAIEDIGSKLKAQARKVNDASDMAINAEATCGRLADDCMRRVQEC
jgi:hypothetical protein